MYQNRLSRLGGVIIVPASDIIWLNTERQRSVAGRVMAADPLATDEAADQHEGDEADGYLDTEEESDEPTDGYLDAEEESDDPTDGDLEESDTFDDDDP
jgi:hypothetical protein